MDALPTALLRRGVGGGGCYHRDPVDVFRVVAPLAALWSPRRWLGGRCWATLVLSSFVPGRLLSLRSSRGASAPPASLLLISIETPLCRRAHASMPGTPPSIGDWAVSFRGDIIVMYGECHGNTLFGVVPVAATRRSVPLRTSTTRAAKRSLRGAEGSLPYSLTFESIRVFAYNVRHYSSNGLCSRRQSLPRVPARDCHHPWKNQSTTSVMV